MQLKIHLDQFRRELKARFPPSAEVTKIEFEGPEIAIYAMNPRAFGEQTAIKDLAKQLRKRIVIRSDPSIRCSHEVAEEEIRKIVPKPLLWEAF